MKKRIKMLISIGIAASLIIISSQSKVHASTPIGTVQVKAHSLYLRAENSFNANGIISYAKCFLGMRYIWASANPLYGGFDCSEGI
ncbi:hypothetical protein [Priestia aryabhattai]|uniref:hypothetical protein n=1 Tax=Priestia aryabhattai TaxID=412384 RepID=UPI000BF174A7|nr:hypothetical protein [Priestia aryabhattai]PEI55034.1 hypothetical protein CN635_19010 [Priestia aryabhattai]